jgi:hypothetical protein
MDTGSIRHWPRMTHDELVKVFPDGKTVHIPSDGQPLPGYVLALAEVERRGGVPSGTSLEAARDAGVITASIERDAAKPKRSLLARIFGAPKDEDEQSEQPAPKRARAPVFVASLTPPIRVATETIVPMPKRKPAEKSFAVASVASNTLDNRLYGRGAIESAALPPPMQSQTPFEVASADPAAAPAEAHSALAYAADTDIAPPAQVRPMGASVPRLPPAAALVPAAANTAVLVKPPLAPALSGGNQRPDSPWLRATILTSSVSGSMTAMRLGPADPRVLHELLLKPAQSLVMTFSDDPHLGMVANQFTGSAVVFLATATFMPQTTASLR